MGNIVSISHRLLAEIVKSGDTVLDATLGKGNDSIFLAELVGPNGHVYAFDIQEEAITISKQRLQERNLAKQTRLIQANHQEIDHYLPAKCQLSAAIFNLGYLPGGNKTITTQFQSTLRAIDQCLERLVAGGRLIIACYIGHPGGLEEYQSVYHQLENLPQECYSVGHFQFINQKNNPPRLLIVERRS
ncbi:class I SAM-dependent methyltransferase [Aerococcus kribbianus]|uniref:class I SAM-dependent methyltransferase n=1 Tax=Aerococcus kribbianus TaxID=2999064 RepID=UPI002E0E26EF|nr:MULTISPECIES: class I SAM-dependent methyltransferase [unclassified Aerococcus]